MKAALDRVIRLTAVSALYIPLYYCPSTTEALTRTGVEIRFYHIGADLLPETVPDETGTAVLLVDYFGVMDEEIKALAASFRHAAVLLDLAHAFYCPPLMREGVYNIYSARKFFGVPDGAYLIAEGPLGETLPSVSAGENAYYLLRSYEEGTNAAYAEKKQTDERIAAAYTAMSTLSLGLLKNADYASVRIRRSENFERYHGALGYKNRLSLNAPFPAYMYPFLCSGGSRLKQELVESRIYVPTLWKSKALSEKGNAVERDLSENAVFLPLDQRYNADDIRFITALIEDLQC